MLAAVDEVLDETGAGDRPRLLALNKVDLLDEERRRELSFRFPRRSRSRARRARASTTCARRSRPRFLRDAAPMELLVPYARGRHACPSCTSWPASWSARTRAEGVRVRARVPGVGGRRASSASRSNGAPGSDAPLPPPDAGGAPAARAPTRATPASTSTRRRRPRSRPASAPAWAPGSPWRSRAGTPASWCRARASPRATGSRWSTRPA